VTDEHEPVVFRLAERRDAVAACVDGKDELPVSDTTTSFCESRIGQPGPQPTACVLPFPPVLTVWRSDSVPSWKRSKTATELPAGLFDSV